MNIDKQILIYSFCEDYCCENIILFGSTTDLENLKVLQFWKNTFEIEFRMNVEEY